VATRQAVTLREAGLGEPGVERIESNVRRADYEAALSSEPPVDQAL
jgi:hypothetical protein